MEDISMRGAVVRISQDSMEAYLTLQPPEAGEGYTLSELVRYIGTQRVTNGIDEAAIQEMIDGGVYMRDVCIAKGQPPVNAENGRYELHFNPDVDGKPKVKEDGSIDYWSIRTVEMVKEGQAIATYYPPTEAVNGMNVSGKPILAVRGKPLQPLRGKGFHCTEDGSTYIADLSGKIEMSNGKIRISAVYEIPGDVGIGTGNVEYHGDVVIHGGIKPGAKVSTSGSLTVDGICENCVIEAGKDIVLRSGVLGGNKTSIRAGGNIHAKFFEYCKVKADGFIEVTYALDSHMISFDHIYVTGKKGSIIGGYAYAISGMDLQKSIEENGEVIKKITTGLKQFELVAAQKGIDVSKDPRRTELLRAKMKTQADIAESQKAVDRLEELVKRGENAKISVVRKVYSGCVVTIDQQTLTVKELQESVCFQKKKEGVVMISLK